MYVWLQWLCIKPWLLKVAFGGKKLNLILNKPELLLFDADIYGRSYIR